MMTNNTTCHETNVETSIFHTTDEKAILSIISTPKRTEAMALFALEHGADSALFINASGTISGNLLNLLGLSSVKRSLAVLRVDIEESVELLRKIEDQFTLSRSMGGIAWIQNPATAAPPPSTEYSMVVAIVNAGEGRLVVEQARRSHPVGASILEAVGSADHTRKTFNFEIVPEKEIVIIISKTEECRAVRDTIYQALRTEKPGRGVLYTTGINAVSGIYQHNDDYSTFAEPHHLKSKTGVCEKDLIVDEKATSQKDLLNEQDVKSTSASSESPKTPQYVGLIAVTDRGHAADIVACAEAAGGRGATIMHGRETSSPFDSWLDKLAQSTRDSVIIISEEKTAQAILSELKANKLAPYLRTFVFDVRDFRLFSYGVSK
ncbi:MAG: hypothetical protein GX910_05005 [Clostridiaceae bacterium]|jgi:nitrogen regulatory protein PII|nr:hypothetical protein [Clostridiaceae bacterium]